MISDLSTNKVFKNGLINIAFQGFPVISALVLIPISINYFGEELWGIYTLAITGLILYNYFNLGITPATTFCMANAFGKENVVEYRKVFINSLTFNLGISIVAVVSLLISKDYLLSLLITKPDLLNEANQLYIGYLIITPIVVQVTLFRSIMEALQKFVLVSILRATLSSFVFLSPLLSIVTGYPIYYSFYLLIVVYLVVAIIYVWFAFSELELRLDFSLLDADVLTRLLGYGKWLAAYSFILPIFLYFDRYYISGQLGEAHVTYYTVALDLISRLSLISGSFTSSFFSAIPYWKSKNDEAAIEKAFKNTVNFLTIVLIPICAFFIIFAQDILSIWINSKVAVNSYYVLQIVTIGTLFNCLCSICMRFLNGINKPWYPAFGLILEAPIYLGLLLFTPLGEQLWTIALLYSGRTFLDYIFLQFYTARFLVIKSDSNFFRNANFKLIVVIGLLAIFILFSSTSISLTMKVASFITFLLAGLITYSNELSKISWKKLSAFLR